MDGYHIERKYLDENGIKYRGAHYTFNSKLFQNDLISLKQNKSG